MGSALRVLLALVLVLTIGLSACGRRRLVGPAEAELSETAADPSTKMSKAPARRLWIDRLLE